MTYHVRATILSDKYHNTSLEIYTVTTVMASELASQLNMSIDFLLACDFLVDSLNLIDKLL